MSHRPVIGITGPDRGGTAAWLFTARAVRRAGGRAVRIQPGQPHPIDGLDGLIIGGGADVSPGLYGQSRRPELKELKDRGASGWRRTLGVILFPLLFLVRRLLTTKTSGINRARDVLEKDLISRALANRVPLMGICRGMQLINVVTGGSLYQNIEGFYEEYPAIRSVLPRKQVNILPATRLAAITGVDTLHVNALHSQAIDRLGKALRVSAVEPNGIVQAIESADDRFIIGVQWHPEYLPQRRRQRALFRALVGASSRSRT
ncbi:gamma-glutamyl-gamma-aminobutyrate hydrolase family protein [Wenzhouxiangella sp. AB-CW3]|uniref:gamma-glutamyl-gamma-aminobutyrate hydrolase family protein n=1 Tax=Wenzhouxiangella sp. AB-CW3 TaxID=2771012 RepID=UPI00168C0941|nr:gamma-glutamyl-gamma-aminobutyrate hydrolase family protein [Wenzhouxiangella sp. AB-CW3]QOC22951.1 gamma-glutamyl-gamma-aminobutyrate hydrolase family protein [Wenzhouxiangella sp. AB-CW3]